MHGEDDDDGPDPLVDEVLGALESALGHIDVGGLKDAVKKGLEEAARAMDRDDVDNVVGGNGSPAADNVVAFDALRGDVEAPAEPERVAVQVLTGGSGQGRLRVSDGWQTVWSGAEPVSYRLSLARGQLEVLVDDQTVAQLLPGQTTDVGGRAIRVRGTGSGHYRRL